MQRTILSLMSTCGAIFVSVVVCTFLFSGCGQSLSSPSGRVSGQVFSKDEGTWGGIVGAKVTCDGRSTVTNTEGYFEIEDVEIGQHTVKASAVGYTDILYGNATVNVEENETADIGCLMLAKITDMAVYLNDFPYDPSVPTIPQHDMSMDEQLQINSIMYNSSIVCSGFMGTNDIYPESSIEFNINGLFKRFKAVAGIDDNLPFQFERYKFRVYVDDVLVFESAELCRSQASTIDVDVENASKILLSVLYNDSSDGLAGSKYAGFGDPRVTLE